MIVDCSALLAILLNEREAGKFLQALEDCETCRMSAINYLEAAIVVDNRANAHARNEFDYFVRQSGLQIEAVTPSQAMIARQAYRDYGKGRHPAGLNLGDCFAYALSKELDEPLLFKGNDFTKTDVRRA
ncbi:MAG: type II toxin-antitoxin system VapC family toxin [Bryobacteraceae bacterium]